MRETHFIWKTNVKHILAGGLFISVVLGGCVTAFSIFALGISSLANVDLPSQSTATSTQVVATPPIQNNTEGVTPPRSPLQNGLQQPFVQNSESDDILGQMHSPIGDAIDDGGVYVGQRVQQAFGSMLKGVLSTLFLEQSNHPESGGAASGTVG